MFVVKFVGRAGADVEKKGEEWRVSIGVDMGVKDGAPITKWAYLHSSFDISNIKRGDKVYVTGALRTTWRLNGDQVDVFYHVQVMEVVIL